MFNCVCALLLANHPLLRQLQTQNITIRTRTTHILRFTRFNGGLLGTSLRGTGGIALLAGDSVNVLGRFLFTEGDPMS